MSRYIVIIWITVIVIIGTWLIYMDKKNYSRIPKKIWVYWDDPDRIPKTVTMCMESWKRYNPEYEIILLTKKNYKGYIRIPYDIATHPNFNDNPTRFSDVVRLYALAEHGGVWIDSSILLKGSLDDWLFPRYGEFSGFYIEEFTKRKEYPVIENWFMACNKGSEFIKLWRDEFIKIANYACVEKYVESRKEMGVDLQNIRSPIYLAMHVGAQKVLQIDKYPVDKLILKKAEDGPFRYLVDAKWDSEKALFLACSDDSYYKPIMKMRGNERKVMEEKIGNELSVERCGWL